MGTIPNLFRMEKDAEKAQLTSRLSMARRPERIIEICWLIRRFAHRQGRPKAGLFTYFWEFEARRDLGDIGGMWRVLRPRDRLDYGKALELERHRWRAKDAHRLMYQYAPMLYLRHHYELGCHLMETGMRLHSRREGWSFEVLYHVYKPVERPACIYEVTLAHFYRELGRDLRTWPLWEAFVDGFHPRLFRLSGVSRDALRKDPGLLTPFFEWISNERKQRLFSGGTLGERDLVEPAAVVKRRQTEVVARLNQRDKDPRRQERNQKLMTLFPELGVLNQL